MSQPKPIKVVLILLPRLSGLGTWACFCQPDLKGILLRGNFEGLLFNKEDEGRNRPSLASGCHLLVIAGTMQLFWRHEGPYLRRTSHKAELAEWKI